MSFQSWLLWPDNVPLSMLALVVVGMAFMYAARRPMHDLFRALGHMVGGPLRMAARSLAAAAAEINHRNKAVLLAHGRQEVGQRVEREFERLGAIVTRDLQGYPTLQRKLLDEITRIEEDYKKCGEVPPPPPDWTDAVAAVANVKSAGNELVLRVLEEIKRSVTGIHDKAIGEYRKAYETRHRILGSFMPFWRSVDKNLAQVEKNLASLQSSVTTVDAHMAKYEQINAGTDKAQHALTVSAFTQFAIALLVMAVAAGGAFINFKLIALPMSEMVGAGDYITSALRTSEVAALVIIFVEASMGLFLLEAMRVTHLFPRIASLNEVLRRRMLWIAFALLVTLAGVEAALALMRDMLIADKQALLQSLSTVQAGPTEGWVGRIPTAGQMLLGFILPFALAFIAIPLESLIHSARTVGGVLLTVLVRALALVLRVAGQAVRQASRVLIRLYDVAIVLPLLAERLVRGARRSGRIGALDAGERAEARLPRQDRRGVQERQRQPLYRHHRRPDPGRGIPERGRRGREDHHHLLRHAGGARQGDGAQLPDQPQGHPGDRGQRRQAQDRQRRSAPLPRAPRRMEGARREGRRFGVARRQRPRPSGPHPDAQLREERAGARGFRRPRRLTNRRSAVPKKNQPPARCARFPP